MKLSIFWKCLTAIKVTILVFRRYNSFYYIVHIMADGKKYLKCRSVLFVCCCFFSIFLVKIYDCTVSILHLFRWILFYLMSCYNTVHPDEGHGLWIFLTFYPPAVKACTTVSRLSQLENTCKSKQFSVFPHRTGSIWYDMKAVIVSHSNDIELLTISGVSLKFPVLECKGFQIE